MIKLFFALGATYSSLYAPFKNYTVPSTNYIHACHGTWRALLTIPC